MIIHVFSGVTVSLGILTVSYSIVIALRDASPTSRPPGAEIGGGARLQKNFASIINFLSSIVGWNDWLYQWIGYADWQYSRTFDITSDQIEGKTVWLKCDGLDTVANVRYR